MKRIVDIEGKQYDSVVKFETCMIFRKAFQKDLLKEFDACRRTVIDQVLGKDVENVYQLIFDTVDHEFLSQLGWACLKTADSSLKAYESFVSDLEVPMKWITFCLICFDDFWAANYPIEVPEEPADEKKTK